MTRGEWWTMVASVAYVAATESGWKWLRRVEAWAWHRVAYVVAMASTDGEAE